MNHPVFTCGNNALPSLLSWCFMKAIEYVRVMVLCVVGDTNFLLELGLGIREVAC